MSLYWNVSRYEPEEGIELVHYYLAYGLMIMAGVKTLTGYTENRKSKKKYYCIIWASTWIILLGLRHPSMGVDLQYGSTLGYLGQFQIIRNLNWKQILNWSGHYEMGYVIFNKLLGYLSDNYQILLMMSAVISIGITARWIYINSDYPVLSSVIYLGLPCFMMNFSGIRQMIAITITLHAYEMIRKRNFRYFLLFVFLAWTFHRSAWIFVIAYPLYWIKMGKKMRTVSIAIPLITYVFRYPLFQMLSRLFKEDAQMDYNNAITLFLVFWAVYAFTVLFSKENGRDENGWRNLFLLACVCQSFAGVYSTAMRIGYYFMPYIAVLLPKIIANTKLEHGNYKRESELIMYLMIFVCFMAFGLHSIANGSWAMSNPHMFFWQG